MRDRRTERDLTSYFDPKFQAVVLRMWNSFLYSSLSSTHFSIILYKFFIEVIKFHDFETAENFYYHFFTNESDVLYFVEQLKISAVPDELIPLINSMCNSFDENRVDIRLNFYVDQQEDIENRMKLLQSELEELKEQRGFTLFNHSRYERRTPCLETVNS